MCTNRTFAGSTCLVLQKAACSDSDEVKEAKWIYPNKCKRCYQVCCGLDLASLRVSALKRTFFNLNIYILHLLCAQQHLLQSLQNWFILLGLCWECLWARYQISALNEWQNLNHRHKAVVWQKFQGLLRVCSGGLLQSLLSRWKLKSLNYWVSVLLSRPSCHI